MQTGQAQGELRQVDPWLGASVMFGSAIRMIHLRLDGMLVRALPEFVDEISEIAWRSLQA